MKQGLVLLLSAASLLTVALAQVITADAVPASAKRALEARFAGVKGVEWKIAGDKNYEAEFTFKSAEITVKFDPAGKCLETEKQIPPTEVPKAVLDVLAKRFTSYKVVETQNLQLHDDPQMIFEIHLDNGREILKTLLYADGTIIKQSVKPKM